MLFLPIAERLVGRHYEESIRDSISDFKRKVALEATNLEFLSKVVVLFL